MNYISIAAFAFFVFLVPELVAADEFTPEKGYTILFNADFRSDNLTNNFR